VTTIGAEGNHPDELLTAAYLQGTLASGEQEAFEAHLADCDSCRAGVALLRWPGAAGGEAVPAELIGRGKSLRPESAQPRRWSLPIAAGLAASLLIVAGLAVWMLRAAPPGRPPDIYRGDAGSAFTWLEPSAGSQVPTTSLVFRWSLVPGADRYVVTVQGTHGENLAVFTVPGMDSFAGWPASQPPPPSGTLIWRIRALALDRVLAESRPIAFEVR